MNQRQEQEWEPQATYDDSLPKEEPEQSFPVEQQENREPAESHMNGWEFLVWAISSFVDWLEDDGWGHVWWVFIVLTSIVVPILAWIFHWH